MLVMDLDFLARLAPGLSDNDFSQATSVDNGMVTDSTGLPVHPVVPCGQPPW